MTLKKAFRVLTFASALWAFLALVATGQVHAVAIFSFLLFFGIAIARHRYKLRMPPGWMWTAINIAVFLAAMYGWSVLQERMYSVTYFFFYLEINKLLTANKNRDYIQIYALTFFHMLAAAVSTESVVFAPVLAVYLFLVVAGMIIFTIKRDAEQAFLIKRARKKLTGFQPHRLAGEDETCLRRIANEKVADRRFAMWMGMMTMLLLLLGSVIFWIVPRTEVSNFLPGLSRRSEGPRTSGFADNITFGGVGEIQTNPTIVMRAVPYPEYIENRPQFLRIRGTSLDYYVGSQWVKSGFVRNRIVSGRQRSVEFPRSSEMAARGGRRFRARLTLEPESSGYLFLIDQPAELQLDESRHLDVDFEGKSVRTLSRYQTLSYDVEGILPGEFELLPEDTTSPADAQESQPTVELPLLISATIEKATELPRFLRSVINPQSAQEYARSVPPPYLETPEGIEDMQTVERLAKEWTAGLTTDHEKALAIQRHLRTEYTYSLKINFSGDENHLTQFLSVARSGHCEYFATSMALMLRKLGIPSRIVNGYLTDEWSAASKRYIIRQEHAHSWVEAVVDNSGTWITFDPTPASGVGSNRINISLYHHFSSFVDAIKVLWYDRFIDYNLNDQRQGMFAFLRALHFGTEVTQLSIGRLNEAWHGTPGGKMTGRRMMGLMLLAAALCIALWIGLQWRRGKSPVAVLRRARHANRAELRAYFDLMRDIEKQYPRPPSQTPLDFARELQHKTGGALEALVPLTRGYYEVRFSGTPWTNALDELVKQVRAGMEKPSR